MRFSVVLAISVLLSAPAPALAGECRFNTAIYDQPDAPWTLQFHAVPRGSAANQTAAFGLNLGSGEVLTGSVYWPNGYSTPVYTIEKSCENGGDDMMCDLLEGAYPTVYVLGEGGIERMPEDMNGPAPSQVLLPKLASAIWYSSHRDAEFGDGMDPGDVFTLKGCD